jgi:predicted dinucleotide-binding enzyme
MRGGGVRIAVMGTGMVGRALSAKLADRGHDVMLGTRDVSATMAQTEPARDGSGSFPEWRERNHRVRVGPFSEAADHGELLFNATAGVATLGALRMAGEENLGDKILIDVANPLDFSKGMPPTLSVCNTDSLAEQIQRAFPRSRVVKSLNTVTAQIMVNPQMVGGGDHAMFVAGNDGEAKGAVAGLLRDDFGWREVLDLGDLAAARGAEMYLILWLGMMQSLQTPVFNIAVRR